MMLSKFFGKQRTSESGAATAARQKPQKQQKPVVSKAEKELDSQLQSFADHVGMTAKAQSQPKSQPKPASSVAKPNTNANTNTNKSHFWSKGTGYGCSASTYSWDVNAFASAKGDAPIISACETLSKQLSVALEKDQDAEGVTRVLEKSCLPVFLFHQLQNDSLVDMERHRDLYTALLALCIKLSAHPVAARLLLKPIDKSGKLIERSPTSTITASTTRSFFSTAKKAETTSADDEVKEPELVSPQDSRSLFRLLVSIKAAALRIEARHAALIKKLTAGLAAQPSPTACTASAESKTDVTAESVAANLATQSQVIAALNLATDVAASPSGKSQAKLPKALKKKQSTPTVQSTAAIKPLADDTLKALLAEKDDGKAFTALVIQAVTEIENSMVELVKQVSQLTPKGRSRSCTDSPSTEAEPETDGDAAADANANAPCVAACLKSHGITVDTSSHPDAVESHSLASTASPASSVASLSPPHTPTTPHGKTTPPVTPSQALTLLPLPSSSSSATLQMVLAAKMVLAAPASAQGLDHDAHGIPVGPPVVPELKLNNHAALAVAAAPSAVTLQQRDEDIKERSVLNYEKLMSDFRFGEAAGFQKHHFSTGGTGQQPQQNNEALTRKFIRRVTSEYADLARSLPVSADSSVFMRVHEEHIEYTQMLITAPMGTPYAGGCFLFDLALPGTYPNVPPKCNLQTTGHGSVRFNPNLYNCGKVCLSLLGTWGGQSGETWLPAASTLLQLAVSIQSLIFVPEPYFNEPGYESSIGTPNGTSASENYNKNIQTATVRYAMLEMMQTPPRGFEVVVKRHFYLRQDAILKEVTGWADKNAAITPLLEQLKAAFAKLDKDDCLKD